MIAVLYCFQFRQNTAAREDDMNTEFDESGMPKRRYTTSLSIDPQTGKQVFKIEKVPASGNNGGKGSIVENSKGNDISNDDIVRNGDKSVNKSSKSSSESWWGRLGW